MMRQVFIFIVAAAIGALLALLLRSAWHRPYDEPAQMPASDGPHDHQSPAAPATPAPLPKPAVDPHAGHAAGSTQTPVNTICAICGMDVDPELPTTDFQGKKIGFACLKCPPKFSADPQRYGPVYLRNEKVP